jgi:uncharacterized DUF497 family protein
MKVFNWDTGKNVWLHENRGICFEDVLYYIEIGGLRDDLVHPNSGRYANQRLIVVEIEKYIYLIPYIETEEELFLKTIIPSRKATRKYLRGDK